MYIQYTCIYLDVYRYIKGGINSANNEVRQPSFHLSSSVSLGFMLTCLRPEKYASDVLDIAAELTLSWLPVSLFPL